MIYIPDMAGQEEPASLAPSTQLFKLEKKALNRAFKL